jgi:uncharacterized beta-barrel protein YwiB (DUF1934 family)
MAEKRPVRIRIVSKSDHHTVEQEAVGELYAKGDHYYIRYAETAAEMGKTVTIVKMGRHSLRIIRHGDICSEQTFTEGERIAGYYDTPHGRLELVIVTDTFSMRMHEGIGIVSWSYRLLMGSEDSGRYELCLYVEEAGNH